MMRAIMRLAADTARETAQAFDPAWLGILRAVVETGPVAPVELAHTLDLHPTSVDRNVRLLVDDQFVEIKSERESLNKTLVAATAAGRAELRQIDDIGVDFLGVVVEDWSSNDVCNLTTLITRLLDNWVQFQRGVARGAQVSSEVG
jgi:DNA-binding MarR family transcriptional regulator